MRKATGDPRTPPWRQIAADLRGRLRAGEWGTSGQLPSIMDIAAQWGVNRKTVIKALTQLKDEGLIEVEPGIGYFAVQAASKQ